MNLQVDIWNPVGLGYRVKTLEPRTQPKPTRIRGSTGVQDCVFGFRVEGSGGFIWGLKVFAMITNEVSV